MRWSNNNNNNNDGNSSNDDVDDSWTWAAVLYYWSTNQTHKAQKWAHPDPYTNQWKHQNGVQVAFIVFSLVNFVYQMFVHFSLSYPMPTKSWLFMQAVGGLTIKMLSYVYVYNTCTVKLSLKDFPYYIWQLYSHVSLQIWAGCHTDLLFPFFPQSFWVWVRQSSLSVRFRNELEKGPRAV